MKKELNKTYRVLQGFGNGEFLNIYLDNSATTKPRRSVIEDMVNMMEVGYGNPSSLHRMGFDAEKKIEHSRKIIASYLNVNQDEIIFTSGGTESNNIAIQGVVNKYKRSGNHIITSKIEHSSVTNIFKHFEENGYNVTYLDVDSDGLIDLKQLEESITKDTLLVSVMYVNNETGVIEPIKEIKEIIKKKNKQTKLHVDGVQAFGKIDINIKGAGIDLFSFSGHKIHGPKGVGGLFMKRDMNLNPITFGGGQEKNLRSGTENTPGIVGLGRAVEELARNFKDENAKLQFLKMYLYNKIVENIEDIKTNSFLDERGTSHILNMSFRGIKSEILLHYLEGDNIYVSTGSACSSKGKAKSPVLKALKLTNDEIEGAIRFSFSYENTIEELDFVVEKVKKAVEEIRKITKR